MKILKQRDLETELQKLVNIIIFEARPRLLSEMQPPRYIPARLHCPKVTRLTRVYILSILYTRIKSKHATIIKLPGPMSVSALNTDSSPVFQ